jgi:hypothetical protein
VFIFQDFLIYSSAYLCVNLCSIILNRTGKFTYGICYFTLSSFSPSKLYIVRRAP